MADQAQGWARLSAHEEQTITDAFSDALSEITITGDFAAAIAKTQALPLFLEHMRAAHFAGSKPKAEA